MSLPVKSLKLKVHDLKEICDILEHGLKQNFAVVKVELVDCPNLTKAPYNLAAEGLCGASRVAEVGGIPNLLPLANKSKNYDFSEIAKLIELPDAYMVGAGAGPHEILGTNSEMIGDVVAGKNASNKSKVSLMNGEKCVLKSLTVEQSACSLMFNIYACEGKPGKVIKVNASKRIGEENFVTCMRKSLTEKYGTDPVAMGGFFRMLSGAARCHVMPCFSTKPLETAADVDGWLKFIDMPAPMTFMSVLMSADPDMDIRLEHSHGYGQEVGGHYHYDVTPEDVSYEGFYNVADLFYRVDQTVDKYVPKKE